MVRAPAADAPARRGTSRATEIEEFPGRLERLSARIASATGARVIVDISNEPHYSSTLGYRADLAGPRAALEPRIR